MNDKRTRLQKSLLAGAGVFFLAFWFPWHRSGVEFGARHDSFSLGIPSSPWYRSDTYEALPGQQLRVDDIHRGLGILPSAERIPSGVAPPEPDATDSEVVPVIANVEATQFDFKTWSSVSFAACVLLLVVSAILRRQRGVP